MKPLLTLMILSTLFSLSFSQGFEISEAARTMNRGTYNSFLFELPDVDKKQAEDDWKAFIGDFKAKAKFDRKSGLWFADDARMPRVSDNTVDVYARIIEDSNPNKKTSVIVWFDQGGAYINSEAHADQAAYVHDILTEYAMTTSKHHALNIVKAEEKSLKTLESELKKLEKNNRNYHDEIEKARELILKMEKNIEINELDQIAKAKEIKRQKQMVGDAVENARKFK